MLAFIFNIFYIMRHIFLNNKTLTAFKNMRKNFLEK